MMLVFVKSVSNNNRMIFLKRINIKIIMCNNHYICLPSNIYKTFRHYPLQLFYRLICNNQELNANRSVCVITHTFDANIHASPNVGQV